MEDWTSIKAWRRTERERLIASRLALPADERARRAEAVVEHLAGLPLTAGSVISFYWPFRGEFDLRDWVAGLSARGVRAALPVVTERNTPMSFRLWSPGARLERGIWNIPVPADGAEVEPDVIIAPLVGHDAGFFRLGYGGGYFDRTLATLAKPPLAVGVGLAEGFLSTIYPQPHDVPMHMTVTEEGIRRR